MHWLKPEYLLKGLFLGLLFYAAVRQGQAPATNPSETLAPINLAILAGIGVALLVSASVKLRQGFQVRGRPGAFLLFLLLESSQLIYAGVLVGAGVGLYLAGYLVEPPPYQDLLIPALGGGLALGIVFCLLRRVRKPEARLGFVFLLNAVLTFAVLYGYTQIHPLTDLTPFAYQLLLGIPFFYLLTFSGRDEETEIEIGAVCAMLAVGLWPLTRDHIQYGALSYWLPPALFAFYSLRLLPRWRVFKHAFRGISFAAIGRHRQALIAFRRALQLDADHPMARDGYWRVHASLDLNKLANDPELLALVDFQLCLDRVGSLLIQGKPPPQRMAEAMKLLELVMSQKPSLAPAVDYWRAVADLHERRTDEAAALLERVVDPDHYGRDNQPRQKVLMMAWQLALVIHPEMRRRVGEMQIIRPGCRMEAIAATERHLTATPNDADAWKLKQVLYQDLTEEDYRQSAAGGKPTFDHAYARELGLSLIQDSARWPRGAEFLRMAADGLPQTAASLYVEIAKAQQRAGQDADSIPTFEMAKRAGRAVGRRNLTDPERKAYFATVKYLGEYYLFHGDVDAALENYHLYTESEHSGIETYRTLAELYEKKGDPLSAARATDQGLLYNSRDKDLLEKKDRYYYSILPEVLKERANQVRISFDTAYCLNKAKSILDRPGNELEWLDVARHLAILVQIIDPCSLSAKVLLARVKLRLGERDEATKEMEGVRTPKPAKFGSREDEDAWFVSCQLLGDLYMELGKADLAVACYNDYRKSVRSGAKTFFKLGQAYEQLGDVPRALKCYKLVVAYDGNPLAPEASSAISRLQTSGTQRVEDTTQRAEPEV